jgi:ParB family chromosome partitioning protein
MADRKLGRGLDGLLHAVGAEPEPAAAPVGAAVTSLPVSMIDPNPFQPRQGLDAAELEHLKESVRQHGVLQPILVRPHAGRYQVVAGERRLRAAQGIGLDEVPVVVHQVADTRMLEVALIENLQRQDLDPIEKAHSFRDYLASTGQTQEQASKRLSLDRSTIANMIRLLDLPDEVKGLVRAGKVGMGHARAILALNEPRRQVAVAERVAMEGLSVRQVERLVAGRDGRVRRPAAGKSPHVRALENRLREALGTKVSVEEGVKPGTGRIVIEFYSQDDVDRILERLS